MIALFDTLLYQPLLNLLAILYEYATFRNLGLSIIVLTIIIRFVLFPLFYKAAKHQSLLQALQPRLKKIQETHKEDRVKQTEAMMALYKEHGVNPFAPFLLLLLQLPVLIALYSVFNSGFSEEALKFLYPFVPNPGEINNSFLWFDLTTTDMAIVFLSAALQYVQARLAIVRTPKTDEPSAADKMGQNMAYISPILTLVVLYNLPSGIALYWLVGTVFSIFQQLLINKHIRHDFEMSVAKAKKNH